MKDGIDGDNDDDDDDINGDDLPLEQDNLGDQPLPPPLPLGDLLLPIILMNMSCLGLPKHGTNLFNLYQILEHDLFLVKNYLEVHLIRTNLELVTCGVLALEEKINLQSTIKLT